MPQHTTSIDTMLTDAGLPRAKPRRAAPGPGPVVGQRHVVPAFAALMLLAGTPVAFGQTGGSPGTSSGGSGVVGDRPGALTQPEPVPAPPSESVSAFEGRPVREVRLLRASETEPLNFEAGTALDESLVQLVRNQLRIREGAAYSAEIVSADLTRLNRLGQFDSIETRIQLMDDGSITLLYLLRPQPTVLAVQSVGNRVLSDQDIAKTVDVLVGTPIDRLQLERGARRIEELYRKKGYYLAQVAIDEDELASTGILIFRVREGERIKVMDIRFEGNRSFSPDEIRKFVKTKTWFWPFERAPLDDDVLEQDVADVAKFFRDRGYLDVRVDRIVKPSPNGKEAIVTFVVDEGRQYTLRSIETYYPERVRARFRTRAEAEAALQPGEKISVRGEETLDPKAPGNIYVYTDGLLTPEQAAGLMAIKPGDAYSTDKLDVSIKRLEEALGKMGYIDRRVTRFERRDAELPVVDVLLQIVESDTSKVGEVVIAGNELTQDKVIRRQLRGSVEPDRPFDLSGVDLAKQKLRNANLFEPASIKVTPQNPDPEDPQYRDVLVEVEETNTGEFSIGASVASDSGVVGRIGLTQRNFDLYDTPDTFGEFFSGRAFRGAGQRFTIEALPGDQVQTYQISLAEPYLFETDYSGSASAFYRDRDYDDYNERRYGGRFTLGRRLGERWSASIAIRAEQVELTDILASNPTDFFEFPESNFLTGLGLTLARNTFDNPIVPTRGTKVEVGAERVGALGGDLAFTVLRAEHQLYLTVNEDFLGRRSVLSFRTAVNYIPEGNEEVPVYERFFLGGSSMRGFRFRTVSPRGLRNDTLTPSNVPVGGTWSFFWGPEFKQPLFEDILSMVFFADTGTVLDEPGLEDYRVSVGFGFRVSVPQLSPAPIAFDFGFPIMKESTDRKRLFTFNIDVPF